MFKNGSDKIIYDLDVINIIKLLRNFDSLIKNYFTEKEIKE